MKYFYLTGTVLFTVYGQLILKWRIAEYGKLPDSLAGKFLFLFKIMLDPFVLSGFISAFIASFFWMAAMTKFDLSFAYPVIVGGLLLITTLLGILFLNEPVTCGKVIGPILIISGIVVMYAYN